MEIQTQRRRRFARNHGKLLRIRDDATKMLATLDMSGFSNDAVPKNAVLACALSNVVLLIDLAFDLAAIAGETTSDGVINGELSAIEASLSEMATEAESTGAVAVLQPRGPIDPTSPVN
jgi:hypothetical protein